MTDRRAYPSDISDARWALIAPTLTAWRQARLDRRPTAEPAATSSTGVKPVTPAVVAGLVDRRQSARRAKRSAEAVELERLRRDNARLEDERVCFFGSDRLHWNDVVPVAGVVDA